MSRENLHLWELVDETDPSYTKSAEFDGRKSTTITGTYFVKRATELFGPIGQGWGYEIREDRYDSGAPVVFNGQPAGNEIMHTIKLDLWYKGDGGEIHTVSHYGHTPYVRMTTYGLKTDFDAPKKSLTDAIKKCLSMLGFSADVFLGEFDNPEYVEARRTEEEIRKADDQDVELAKKRAEFGHWCEDQIKAYKLIPNPAALKTVHKANLKKAANQSRMLNLNQDKIMERVESAYKARLDELLPEIDLVCKDCGTAGKGKEGSDCPECQGKRSPAK